MGVKLHLEILKKIYGIMIGFIRKMIQIINNLFQKKFDDRCY